MAEGLKQRIQEIKDLAKKPLSLEREKRRVEIVMLKFKEDPSIIDKAVCRIIHNTDWPFKLTIFDNRPLPSEENNRNTSRIWNKLVADATCDYILIIDSDAFIPEKKTDPCWLTRMMQSINETGIVVPVSSSGGGFKQHVSGPLSYPSFMMNTGAWSGFCFLFKKSLWHKQKFDDRFYIYGQDSEWAVRTQKIVGGAVMRRDVYVEHMGGYSFKKDPIRDTDKIYAQHLFRFLTKKRNV